MLKRFFCIWFPIAAAGTVVLLIAYVAIQQDYRQNANDPQIEFAGNAIVALSSGYKPDALISALPKVDMAKSLSVFAMIFDDSGKLVASSALNGNAQPFVPPHGVLDYVLAHGEDRVTWQTPSGLRFAAVIDRFSSGYFLAARSLKEAEARIGRLGLIFLAGWLALMIVTAGAAFLSIRLIKPTSA